MTIEGPGGTVRQLADKIPADVTVTTRARRMLRYVRIVVTALSLTACLLLIVYVVRSYRTLDLLELYCGYGYSGHIGSFDRGIEFCVGTGKTEFPNAKPGIKYHAVPKRVQPVLEQGLAKYGFRAFTGPRGVSFPAYPSLVLDPNYHGFAHLLPPAHLFARLHKYSFSPY